MLPEPTLPKRRASAPASPQPWVMTPLFRVPDGDEPDAPPAPERWAARTSGRSRRASPRRPASRARRDGAGGEAGPLQDPPDLLAVTAQRLRRALARSFLRYGVPGDPEVAVDAAMNVVEPVLQARDTEILRLRRLRSAKVSGR
jgi:hypothetical protein